MYPCPRLRHLINEQKKEGEEKDWSCEDRNGCANHQKIEQGIEPLQQRKRDRLVPLKGSCIRDRFNSLGLGRKGTRLEFDGVIR